MKRKFFNNFSTSGLILSSMPPLKTFSKSCGTSVTFTKVMLFMQPINEGLVQLGHLLTVILSFAQTPTWQRDGDTVQLDHLTLAVQVELPVKLAEGRRPRHLVWFEDSLLIWGISFVQNQILFWRNSVTGSTVDIKHSRALLTTCHKILKRRKYSPKIFLKNDL